VADFRPSCKQAEDDLVGALNALRQKRLIKSPLSDEQARKAISKCKPCSGERPNPRKCCGWTVKFSGLTAVEIAPFTLKGRTLNAKITGQLNFEQSIAPRDIEAWQASPASRASCAIEIWDATGRESAPYSRHHIDLANHNQEGPVWHLQLGGLSSEKNVSKDFEWLDVPRWPSAPMDLILVLELSIYSFHHSAWNQLRVSNPWREIVKRSELLMLDQFRKRLNEYCSQREVSPSWLSFQCNRTSRWNPRPRNSNQER
jgi:hypothetical protein